MIKEKYYFQRRTGPPGFSRWTAAYIDENGPMKNITTNTIHVQSGGLYIFFATGQFFPEQVRLCLSTLDYFILAIFIIIFINNFK
jgi:hypothetical protein